MDISGESQGRVASWPEKVSDWLSSNPARVVLTCAQVAFWLGWAGWSVTIMWRVISGTYLETTGSSPTYIRLDLLQALAFLVAWSLLLLTITIRVVNKARDLEATSDQTSWRLDQIRELDKGREVERKDFFEEVDERLSGVETGAVQVIQDLRQENEQLRQENEQFRQTMSSDS